MSEEKDKSNLEDVKLQWEIEKLKADVENQKNVAAKAAADAEQVLVNVEKTKAELESMKLADRKADAEAKKAEISLLTANLEWEKVQEKRQKEKAVDDENFVYRFGSDVSSGSVGSCMKKLTEWHRRFPKCSMEIIYSSPGGSIIDGFELFDFIQHLRGSGHHITTGTLGMAASMAGILLQAGDVRWIGHQSWLMIHRAAFGAWGKTFEIEDEVKFVKRIEERILDIFVSRSKLTRNKIKRNWERKDWWISADEAVEMKLVDEVRAALPEHNSKK
jgi:ATP-dependent Clp protease protease subunit